MINLSLLHQKILANQMPIHFASVSGVVTTKPSLIRYADQQLGLELITTKSFQVLPNPGNREPILCEMGVGSFGNSVGLRNPGLEVALAQLREFRASYQMKGILNVSLSASSVADFITLVRAFAPVADMLELNFSCPHAEDGYGSDIGSSADIASLYVREIRLALPDLSVPLFIKLTPNVTDIGTIASSVVKAGCDGLVAINTAGPVQYIEPISNKPILQNKLGGKGGQSGTWIFERALQCVQEVRAAVGPQVPLIGMGGVSTAEHVVQMIRSGADVVGIGSAFAKVHQRHWPSYLKALKEDASSLLGGLKSSNSCSEYVTTSKSMEYHQRAIIKRTLISEDILLLTLSGRWEYEAGQFVFLWLPQVGEKPFSIAHSSPLSFIIKKRGPFTEALFALEEGDPIYLRGLYGEQLQAEWTKRSLLIAGGTGVAVLPALAQSLQKKGSQITSFIGTATDVGQTYNQMLQPYGEVITVADEGKVGRILTEVEQFCRQGIEHLGCYVVGPTAFMRAAVELLLQHGVSGDKIHLSLELNTMCGVGLCGECACGDKLTCQWGTFVSWHYLATHAPELI